MFVALDGELNREVALKQILDHHADDPASRQRFLAEAEITGGLEHPGIVPVYGLGTYAGGRPYYAMRFIRGDSLKEAIDRFHAEPKPGRDPGRRSLELRKLLRQFIDVCNAIDYAHSRGVLHRDIKPGNIIIGKHGETLVVDWGLAKAVDRAETSRDADERLLRPSLSSGSAETLPGTALGTPAFMSPEQACGDLDRLGRHSDVYSLGATLYGLLTGKPAFEGEIGEVLRKVGRGEFPRPRLADPTVDPALEAVCLKAMALKPEDRYSTARAMADDVERWTADEPVTAWREPLARRARRWARRNRTAVTGGATALAAGVIGLAAVEFVLARANADLRNANSATTLAKNDALKALAETVKAKGAADLALTSSKESLQRTEAVLTFLKDDVLAAARPAGRSGGLSRAVTVREALDSAEPKIAGRLKGQPAVEADIRDTLGQTYYYLGDVNAAIRQLGIALELREHALGLDHPDTLSSRTNLAVVYTDAGRIADAIRLHEETAKLAAVKLGADDPFTLNSRTSLAVSYLAAGRIADAIRIHEETLKIKEAKLGVDHLDTLTTRGNLASAYRAGSRIAEAIALGEKNLNLREAKVGPDHPDTFDSRNMLAEAYRSAGRTAEAIPMHEKNVKDRAAKLGPEHPTTLLSRSNLVNAYLEVGRTAEALVLGESTLKIWESKFGPDHPGTLSSRSYVAGIYAKLGRWADAERLWRENLLRRRKTGQPNSPQLATDLAALGTCLIHQSSWSEAETLLRECLAIRMRTVPNDWSRFQAMSNLGEAVMGQGRYAEAEPLLVGGYEGLHAPATKVPAMARRFLAESGARVVRLYDAWRKPEEARIWRKKLGLVELPANVFAPVSRRSP